MQKKELELAEKIREICVKAAREGFMDASVSGLCTEGAMEAAISAIQMVDIEKEITRQKASGKS